MNFEKIKEKIIDFLFERQEITEKKQNFEEHQEIKKPKNIKLVRLNNSLEKAQTVEVKEPKTEQLPLEKKQTVEVKGPKTEQLPLEKKQTVGAKEPKTEQLPLEVKKESNPAPKIEKKQEDTNNIEKLEINKEDNAVTDKKTNSAEKLTNEQHDEKSLSNKEENKEPSQTKEEKKISKEDELILEKEKQRVMSASYLTETEKDEIIEELYESFKNFEDEK